MKQYTVKNRHVPISLRNAVITEVHVTGTTVRLVFTDGIRDSFKRETVWTGRATVTIPSVNREVSSLVHFNDNTYDARPIQQLSDVVKVGRFEIEDELYGDRQLLFRCMWLTDTTCETVELRLSYAGELIIQWQDELTEEMYHSESL